MCRYISELKLILISVTHSNYQAHNSTLGQQNAILTVMVTALCQHLKNLTQIYGHCYPISNII